MLSYAYSKKILSLTYSKHHMLISLYKDSLEQHNIQSETDLASDCTGRKQKHIYPDHGFTKYTVSQHSLV